MYPLLFVKGERHHVSQTTTLGTSPPLTLGFHPSKRHAALIASCDQGSVVLDFTLASIASYPDVRSMPFSRSVVLLLLIVYEYHIVFTRSCYHLILALVA